MLHIHTQSQTAQTHPTALTLRALLPSLDTGQQMPVDCRPGVHPNSLNQSFLDPWTARKLFHWSILKDVPKAPISLWGARSGVLREISEDTRDDPSWNLLSDRRTSLLKTCWGLAAADNADLKQHQNTSFILNNIKTECNHSSFYLICLQICHLDHGTLGLRSLNMGIKMAFIF